MNFLSTLQSKVYNTRNKKLKGFTLMEMVAVIGVLVIIGMLTRPVFSDVREKQRQANFESDINSIQSIALHFADEFGLHALADTNRKVVIGNETLGTVAETDTTIPVDTDRTEFTTSDNEVVSLLVPITDKHPLVTMGYLNKAPKNPWEGDARLGSSSEAGKEFSYVYVIDFKTTKKLIANPDGSRDQSTKVIPQVRLMKMTGSGADAKLHRNDFVTVYNGKALRTGVDSDAAQIKNNALKDSLRIYGFDFLNKTSGDNSAKDPLWNFVLKGMEK